MFEFEYCVELMVVHRSIDPAVVGENLPGLRPTVQSRAGVEKRDANGTPTGRRAQLSVWTAPLHPEKRLHSERQRLSEFLRTALEQLSGQADLFRSLWNDGRVVLRIGWFSDENHSADAIDADVIRTCAELGLGIELNYYAPRDVAEDDHAGSAGAPKS